jgi:hypothetical protein
MRQETHHIPPPAPTGLASKTDEQIHRENEDEERERERIKRGHRGRRHRQAAALYVSTG